MTKKIDLVRPFGSTYHWLAQDTNPENIFDRRFSFATARHFRRPAAGCEFLSEQIYVRARLDWERSGPVQTEGGGLTGGGGGEIGDQLVRSEARTADRSLPRLVHRVMSFSPRVIQAHQPTSDPATSVLILQRLSPRSPGAALAAEKVTLSVLTSNYSTRSAIRQRQRSER